MALEEEEPERERPEDDEALDEGEVGGYLERGGVVGELYGEKPERRAQQQREDGDDRAAGPWLKAHAPGDAVEERERAGAREGRGRGEQRGEAAGDELSRLTDVEPERAQGDEGRTASAAARATSARQATGRMTRGMWSSSDTELTRT